MTLYDYIKKHPNIDELTVWDKDYDLEVYFYPDILNPSDSWDTSMAKFAKKLTVVAEHKNRYGVAVNMSEVIMRNIYKPVMAQLFNRVSIDAIMCDMPSIMSGYVGEKWLEIFVSNLT